MVLLFLLPLFTVAIAESPPSPEDIAFFQRNGAVLTRGVAAGLLEPHVGAPY